MSLSEHHHVKQITALCEQYMNFKCILVEKTLPSTLIEDVSKLYHHRETGDITFEIEKKQVKAHKVRE